jgi:hypothetical protein|tara:strand:+ start:1441 stop:2022 length:582 start_codon:yes stop_codon:yes gene_type:complete
MKQKCIICDKRIAKNWNKRSTKWEGFCNNTVCDKINQTAKKYHTTALEAVDILERKERGTCECCGSENNEVLHIEHCHTTELVRGVACASCNVKIGKLESDKFNVDYPDFITEWANKTKDKAINPHYLSIRTHLDGKSPKDVDIVITKDNVNHFTNKERLEWEECLLSDWKPEEEVKLSAVEKDDILSSLLKR